MAKVFTTTTAPSSTIALDGKWHGDALSVQNPGEEYTQGAIAAFALREAKKPKPSPWSIVAVAAAVLVLAGSGCKPKQSAAPESSAAPASSAAPTSSAAPASSAPPASNAPEASVVVPDLKGKTLIDAHAALAQVNLKVGNVANVLGDVASVDKVLSQSPPAGQSVNSESTVDLQVGVAIVVVPSVVGKTYAEAADALRAVALEPRVALTNQPRAKPSQVLDSNPKAGDSVKSRTSVTLMIQEGYVQVPNVIGQPFQVAVATLAQNNLAVGTVTGSVFQMPGPAQIPVARVTDQNPKAGAKAPVGYEVNLVFPGRNVLPQAVVVRLAEAARARHQ